MATMEKMPGSQVKMIIEVPADKFEEAVQKAYAKEGKKYNVQGFRKGHVPRKVIENNYGPLIFFDTAFEIVYPEAYQTAAIEHNLVPVGQPDVSILDIGNLAEDKPVVFGVVVPVYPEITLGEYKGIEVTKREYTVTDEMLDAAMQQERERVARFVEVEREVQDGDNINLDYSGSVDGVKFDGGTAEGASLVIGSHMFIPGFEEQMIGMQVGEEKDVQVTFPDPYQSEGLAGKEAVFHVKVNGIMAKELPELDDGFAQDVSEFDTIVELLESKRKALQEEADKQAKSAMENEAIHNAVENAQMEVPEAMVESQLDYMVQEVQYRLSSQGLTLEQYFQYTGATMEMMRADLRKEALSRVKTQLVIDEIVKAEGFESQPEEIEVKIEDFAKRLGRSVEDVKKNLSAQDEAYFKDQIVSDKAVRCILDSMVKVEKKEEEKEAAEAAE